MPSLLRRLQKLESLITDRSGCAPHSTAWLEYWKDKLDRFLSKREHYGDEDTAKPAGGCENEVLVKVLGGRSMYRDVFQWTRIRRRVLTGGISQKQVGRESGISRKTVRKMIEFPIPPEYRRKNAVDRPKLGPCLGLIDHIVTEDQGKSKKQQHTAREAPGYRRNCWRLICRYAEIQTPFRESHWYNKTRKGLLRFPLPAGKYLNAFLAAQRFFIARLREIDLQFSWTFC
jgi:hypothetical protein